MEPVNEQPKGIEQQPKTPTEASKGFLERWTEKLMNRPEALGILGIPLAAFAVKNIAQGDYWKAAQEAIAAGFIAVVIPHTLKRFRPKG